MEVRLKTPYLFAAFALIILTFEVWLVHSVYFLKNSRAFSLGITFDIALLIPTMYYFLVMRKQEINYLKLLVIFVLSARLAWFILPNNAHDFLRFLPTIFLLIEPILIGFTIFRIRKIYFNFKKLTFIQPDFIKNLELSFERIGFSNKLSRFMVSEISMLRYGLFFWKGKKEILANQKHFTYHKESAYVAIMLSFLMVALVETSVVHLLLIRHYPKFTWVLFGLSIYSFILLIADISATLKRPILVENNMIILRIGLRWQTIIEQKNISNYLIIKEINKKDKTILNGSLTLNNFNLMLVLKEPVKVFGMFGMTKTVSKIALEIDGIDDFLKEISAE